MKAIVFHSAILGFDSMLRQCDGLEDNSLQLEVKHNVERTIMEVVGFFGEASNITQRISYHFFSGSLYVFVSYDRSDNKCKSDALLIAMVFARVYSAIMLNSKLCIRGAIACGSHHEDGAFVFSVSQIKAVDLSYKSIFPRVLIADELIDFIGNGFTMKPNTSYLCFLDNSILKDEHHQYFVTPTSIQEDCGEIKGYSNASINAAIQFIETEIAYIDKYQDRVDEYMDSYLWLKDLLYWLCFERNDQLSGIRSFSSVRIGVAN